MTPPTPTLKEVKLDVNAVHRDPKAESLAWLQQFAKENGKVKGMGERELKDYSPDELYAELDRIGVEKARLPRKRRDQYTQHSRNYWNERRKEVTAELKRRKLPARRQGSQRTYATAAHLAAARKEAIA